MILRRVFSITGFIAVIFFIQHLFINFFSSFWLINKAKYFISMITFYHTIIGIKYLEIVFIAIPFILHGLIGLKYMIKKRYSLKTDVFYDQQKGCVFQRITAWILLIGIALHVLQMRFINHPIKTQINNEKYFAVKVKKSDKIYKVAKKLNFKILEKKAPNKISYQKVHVMKNQDNILDANQTYALTKNSSKALLIVIINNFQSKIMVFLYTVYVIAASFHVFNGLWLFLISFKIIKTDIAKKNVLKICMGLVFLYFIFGLSAIWVNFLTML